MGAEEKNRNEILSQIVADLSAKSQGGEDLSSKTRRLREEIRKLVENENTIFGKFRALVESFREIIPEEKQRYSAAIKALSATSKLSRQEIVKGVNNQLEELKILEKGLMSAIPGWRDEMKAMEAKARELKDDIARLRETIGRLEGEEKGILASMAARQKDMELVEKAVGEVFTDIGAVITSVRKKIEESSAESASAQTATPKVPLKSDIFPAGEKGGSEQKIETPEPSAPQNTEWQKKCPMCGGRMDFHIREKMWMCYVCAYEEPGKNEVNEGLGKSEQKIEIPEPSAPQNTEWQKKCPMCGGRMDFHIREKMWMCYVCAYEEKEDEGRGRSAETSKHTDAPQPAPASEIFDASDPFAESPPALTSDENGEPIKGSILGSSSSKHKPSTKKKTCPSCRKKMNWHEEDRAWRCPFCEYERRI